LEITMVRTSSLFAALLIAIAGTLAATCARAQSMDEGTFDIGPKFRAKIAKEMAKQAQLQGSTGTQGGFGSGDGGSQCGAQNIGNIDTNGRPGSSPREVFVFAPNAINMVNNGCN
jgi:hypothetical protein